MKDINRIKVVIVEKKKTNKWLAEHLRKDPATISKWCTNTSQPDLATLLKVANLLEAKGIEHSELTQSEYCYPLNIQGNKTVSVQWLELLKEMRKMYNK